MVADARKERGKVIAERCRPDRDGDRFFVPSQSGAGGRRRAVAPAPNTRERVCTGPDYDLRGMKCRHTDAVECSRTRTPANRDGSKTVTTVTVKAERKTCPPDWPACNAAQTNERRLFHVPLSDLCDTIPEPVRPRPKGGRPPLPLRDAVFSARLKAYALTSARRFAGELDEAAAGGFIRSAPHVNSVLSAFDRDGPTPVVKGVAELSALPPKAVETVFAVDSTGFATASYSLWKDLTYGTARKESKWVKAHFRAGVKTNVGTAVNVERQSAADSPRLPGLVGATAKAFEAGGVSADKADLSVSQFDAVEPNGGRFFPAVKTNATGSSGGSFEKAFHYFSFKKDECLQHYRQRANVESTASLVTRTFGDAVEAKGDAAQRNEVYAKFVCHDLCVLIAEMYAMGVAAMCERPAPCTIAQPAAHQPPEIRGLMCKALVGGEVGVLVELGL